MSRLGIAWVDGRVVENFKTRDKGEAMVDDVRVVEEGAADYGTRGRYDPPKLWFSCPSSCSVC